MRQLFSRLLIILALGSLAPFASSQPPPVAAGDRICFPETGYCAENAFLAFWRTHGALPVLGLAIGPALRDDDGRLVQFYQRAVMEWHPDNAPAFQVQLARLGAERLGERAERHAPPTPCTRAACVHFAETDHTLRGAFLHYWRNRGGLAVFGLPLTEEFREVNPAEGQSYTVQYFERARFEYHPEHRGTAHEVQLGLLGSEAWQARPELHDRPAVAVPDVSAPVVGLPARLSIPTLGINALVEHVGQEPDGAMAAPSGAFTVGWYAPGTRPGQPGSAVIAGHVDFRGVGPAVFWNLRRLTPGDEVWVAADDGTRRRFVVEEVASYLAEQAPIDRIFGAGDGVHLNLITCAGDFDPTSRSYDRRLVVYTRWDGTVE